MDKQEAQAYLLASFGPIPNKEIARKIERDGTIEQVEAAIIAKIGLRKLIVAWWAMHRDDLELFELLQKYGVTTKCDDGDRSGESCNPYDTITYAGSYGSTKVIKYLLEKYPNGGLSGWDADRDIKEILFNDACRHLHPELAEYILSLGYKPTQKYYDLGDALRRDYVMGERKKELQQLQQLFTKHGLKQKGCPK